MWYSDDIPRGIEGLTQIFFFAGKNDREVKTLYVSNVEKGVTHAGQQKAVL
jgi:hypothetical protein